MVLLSDMGGGGATTVDQSFLAPSPTAGAGGSALILERWGEREAPERLSTAWRRSWRRMPTEPGFRGGFLVGCIGEKGRPRPRPLRLHGGAGVELAGGGGMD